MVGFQWLCLMRMVVWGRYGPYRRPGYDVGRYDLVYGECNVVPWMNFVHLLPCIYVVWLDNGSVWNIYQ